MALAAAAAAAAVSPAVSSSDSSRPYSVAFLPFPDTLAYCASCCEAVVVFVVVLLTAPE